MAETLMAYSNTEHQAGSSAGGGTSLAETMSEATWFAAKLRAGCKHRETLTVTVTPGLAALMLTRNASNRNITRAQVAQHVERLERGTFILTHQGIAFAANGELNDGQHRLTAIAESGISAKMQVTFGAKREEFQVVDQGSKRTGAHVLQIMGKGNTVLRASIATSLLSLKTGQTTSEQQAVVAYANELDGPVFDEAIRWAQNMVKVTSPTAAGVAHYVISGAISDRTRDLFDAFCTSIRTGEDIQGPRLRLREWLLRKDDKTLNAQGVSMKRSAAIILTWNAYRNKRARVDLSWPHVVKLPPVTL